MDNNEYQPEDNTLWKKIRGLQVQPNVRNFLWRAIKNSIPTKLNLRRRTILADDRCDQCKGATEDVLHALWSCPLLSQVWSHDIAWNYNASLHFLSFRDLVEHIMEIGNVLNLFATMVWAIWYRRKSIRTTAKPFPIKKVFLEVQNARASFVRIIPPRPPDQPSQTPPRLIWKPPPWSKLKVNFDGSVFRKDNLAGVGSHCPKW